MKTALFVDFDNVYLGLKRTDPRAAEVFAAHPARWLAWLENPSQGALAHARRETLIRKCYLNPRSFYGYRHHFVCSGFEVVDCPPLTSHAKNGSDIRMVMDILDTLQHPTRFDEFMLLSGDADFTPVLLRLRAHDRRTAVLAVSHAVEAYTAACHWVITENLFIREALGVSAPAPASAPTLPPPAPPGGLHFPPLALLTVPPSRTPRTPDQEPRPSAAPPPAASDPLIDELKKAILACVQRVVAESPHPLKLVSVAEVVMHEVGQRVIETRWAGAGRFKSLLRELNPAGLQLLTNVDPGYILDPKRHAPPPESPKPPSPQQEAPATFEQRVQKATQTPLLTQQQYAALFKTAAEVLRADSNNLTATSKEIRDRLAASNENISRGSVSFVVKGVLMQSPASDTEPRDTSVLGLAQAFTRNVIRLCQQAQLELTPEDLTRLEDWIAGGLMAPGGSPSRLL